MKNAARFSIVLVTMPDLKSARKLAKAILETKLAACISLIPRLESCYWWQGKMATSSETLLMIKTASRNLGALEKFILARHPYDMPEILALPLRSGNQQYLNWLSSSLCNKS